MAFAKEATNTRGANCPGQPAALSGAFFVQWRAFEIGTKTGAAAIVS
jgi:hypothetical protein